MTLDYGQPMSEETYNLLMSGGRPFGDNPFGLPPGTDRSKEATENKSDEEVTLPNKKKNSMEKPWNDKSIYELFGDFNRELTDYSTRSYIPNGY